MNSASPAAPNAERIYSLAEYLRAQALDNGWTVTPIRTDADNGAAFVARDIPRCIEIQTEVSHDGGLRSWRLEHRTQSKVSDQVVAWFEQH